MLLTRLRDKLEAAGIESHHGPNFVLPDKCVFEPPCGIKWLQIEYMLSLGAFSYAVSGYAFAANIGRYCSIGEDVQIGRQDHPMDWVSTSPAFYLTKPLFNLPAKYKDAPRLSDLSNVRRPKPSTKVKVTNIENDVWIGHGAFIRAGVRIGTGAVVAANAVVVKDVPPYAVVAGNPATIKKFRVPPHLIGALLGLQWWRYAAWDLAELQMEDPKLFIPAFRAAKESLVPYEPEKFRVAEVSKD